MSVTRVRESEGNQPTFGPPECGNRQATNQPQGGSAREGLQLGKTAGCWPGRVAHARRVAQAEPARLPDAQEGSVP
eukprot:3016131-Prymnesium_polylepis.1